MRCTSQTSEVAAFSCFKSGTPMVRFGTKWPSITSMCTHSAALRSIISISCRSCPKSADRTDGAMIRFIY